MCHWLHDITLSSNEEVPIRHLMNFQVLVFQNYGTKYLCDKVIFAHIDIEF